MKLSIVIPAYNEEEAIETIVKRCLSERENIINNTYVDDVEVIVVNDGSKDKTYEIVSKFKDIKLVNHEKNKGYGAALKTGFREATGELISFLDADGTCNPRYFIDLCNILIKENADISVGSRMNARSNMPKIRKIGNLIFAKLINLMGDANITDSASGMRVMKKKSLDKLYPLPDGLHFTPAMSCRAVMDKDLKMVEAPIEYKERIGESKLGIIHDGIRFLKIIGDISLSYNPMRFFGSISLFFFGIAILYSISPVSQYLLYNIFHDTVIYRLITIIVLVVTGLNFLTIGTIAQAVVNLQSKRGNFRESSNNIFYKILSQKSLILSGTALILIGIFINYKTILQYITTGVIKVHWLYVVAGAFFVLFGFQTFTMGILKRIIRNLLEEKLFRERNTQ